MLDKKQHREKKNDDFSQSNLPMANRKETNTSETAVRISMPYLTNLIVSLPLVGMVASFITSVLFTKEQIFESECGVSDHEE